ncbi:MAG: VOC family protein [Armatimonadetes bacterium]|nr:VOC family protein [Armatimonadota bacterium]
MSRARLAQVMPVLPVLDVQAGVRYYTENLGFALRFQDTPDFPHYAVLERDSVTLHLQWHDPSEFEAGQMYRFVVDDVDSLFAEYSDKGVFHDQTALRDTDWGTREFAFFDRDHNGLVFMCNR